VTHSLEVFSGDELVFFSDGKWIYPLFELERFLVDYRGAPEGLLAVDKIVGKAAAMMLVHLGIGQIHAGMMSSLAAAFLRQRQVSFSCDVLVDQILCRTEELLADIDDLDADPTPRATP
jgi:zinc transport system ATP-binding protein